jgi:hypothetical protein
MPVKHCSRFNISKTCNVDIKSYLKTLFVVLRWTEENHLHHVIIPKDIWKMLSVLLPEVIDLYKNKQLTKMKIAKTEKEYTSYFVRENFLQVTFSYINRNRKQVKTTLKLSDDTWNGIHYNINDINRILFDNLVINDNGQSVVFQYKWLILNRENYLIDESNIPVFDKKECHEDGKRHATTLEASVKPHIQIKRMERIMPDYHQLFMWVYLYMLQHQVHLLSKMNCECDRENHTCLLDWSQSVNLYFNLAQMRIKIDDVISSFMEILHTLNCTCADKVNIANSCMKFLDGEILRHSLTSIDIPVDFEKLFQKKLKNSNDINDII